MDAIPLIYLILFILFIIGGSRSSRGGVIVKNYPKTSKKGSPPPAIRPKVHPAPQKGK